VQSTVHTAAAAVSFSRVLVLIPRFGRIRLGLELEKERPEEGGCGMPYANGEWCYHFRMRLRGIKILFVLLGVGHPDGAVHGGESERHGIDLIYESLRSRHRAQCEAREYGGWRAPDFDPCKQAKIVFGTLKRNTVEEDKSETINATYRLGRARRESAALRKDTMVPGVPARICWTWRKTRTPQGSRCIEGMEGALRIPRTRAELEDVELQLRRSAQIWSWIRLAGGGEAGD
ncbi:hypothetical protein B0H16DRAFT_1856783, partial [Mycena metata]